jgi:muconate cycloisomerase
LCSDGIAGIGDGTTIGGLSYGAESPEGMKLAIDQYITPILKTLDPARVQETMAAIRNLIKGNNFAKCALNAPSRREIRPTTAISRIGILLGRRQSSKYLI